MKKKTIKILTVIIMMIMLFFTIDNFVCATSGSGLVNQFNGTAGSTSTERRRYDNESNWNGFVGC